MSFNMRYHPIILLLLMLFCTVPFRKLQAQISGPVSESLSLLPGDDGFQAMDVFPNGDVVAVGYTQGKEGKGKDILVQLADSTGKVYWTKNIGYTHDDEGRGVLINKMGQIIVVGSISLPGASGFTEVKPIMLIFSKEGRLVDRFIYYDPTPYAYWNTVAEDDPGHYFLGGSMENKPGVVAFRNHGVIWKKSLDADPGSVQKLIFLNGNLFGTGSAGNNRLLTFSMNQDGDILWQKRNQEPFRQGVDLIAFSSEELIVAANAWDPRLRDQAGILKVDAASGKILASQLYGGRFRDEARTILRSDVDTLILFGLSYSHLRQGAHRSQGWIQIIDSAGNAIREQYLGGSQDEWFASARDLTSGRILVLGQSASGDANGADGWMVRLQAFPQLKNFDWSENPWRWHPPADTVRSGEKLISWLELTNSGSTPIRTPEVAIQVDGQTPVRATQTSAWIAPGEQIRKYFAFPFASQNAGTAFIQLEAGGRPLAEAQFFAGLAPEEHYVVTLDSIRLDDHQEDYFAFLPLQIKNAGNTSTQPVQLKLIAPGWLELDNDLVPILVAPGETREIQVPFHLGQDAGDSLYLEVLGSHTNDSILFMGHFNLDLGRVKSAYQEARQQRISVVALDALKNRSLGQITSDQVEALPLDSFLQKVSVTGFEPTLPAEEEVVKEPAEVVWQGQLFWIQPDPIQKADVVHTQLDRFPLLLRYVSNQPVDSFWKVQALVHYQGGVDTVSSTWQGGSYVVGYQYNLQASALLHEGENRIEVLLSNAEHQCPVPDVFVYYEPPRVNLHVYAYGVPFEDLPWVSKDAQDFSQLFSGQEDLLFDRVNTTVYNSASSTTTQAIRKSIRDIQLDYLEFSRIKPNDVLIFYWSSHGFVLDDRYRLAASDFDFLYEEETSLDFQTEVLDKLKLLPCKKILFIDACYSGSIANLDVPEGVKSEPIPDEIALSEALHALASSANDFYFVLSCGPGELSYADDRWDNSAFTLALKEGLTTNGIDRDDNRIITLGEWYEYARDRVPELVAEKKDIITTQRPVLLQEPVAGRLPIFIRDE